MTQDLRELHIMIVVLEQTLEIGNILHVLNRHTQTINLILLERYSASSNALFNNVHVLLFKH